MTPEISVHYSFLGIGAHSRGTQVVGLVATRASFPVFQAEGDPGPAAGAADPLRKQPAQAVQALKVEWIDLPVQCDPGHAMGIAIVGQRKRWARLWLSRPS